jgi:hypothetical protein
MTLVCTFFPWVGTFLGGSPVDSQGPWRAIFGAVNRNIAWENAMQTPNGWLDDVKSNWELMLPSLILLIVVVALAWADHGLHALDPRKIPPLAGVWLWRHAVIAGLAGFVFVLMMIQVIHGFGLETAIRKVVTEMFAAQREAAAAKPSQLKVIAYNEEQEYAKFNLERTTWLYLGLTCNFLAVLAMLCKIGLDRRGSKPPPQIVIQY